VARTRGYFDRASVRGMYLSLGVGLLVLLLAVPAGIVFGAPAVIPAAAGVAIMLLSLLIAHRSAAGEKEARRWLGLKRYLKRFGAQGDAQAQVRPHLDALLVYGVVLGLGPKVYRALTADLSAQDAHAYFPWYLAHGGPGGFGAEGFASAFSSMVGAATSTVSSASGAGGGASGGGGGGAGGGGGGAG
jgi:uncharacterized membrane protein